MRRGGPGLMKLLAGGVCRRLCLFFFSSRRRHTRCSRDWSSECALPILATKTWATFCRENGIDHVDLLKLDCEGMDARILADMARTGPWPRVIVAEVCTVGDLGEELARAEVGLTSRGYRSAQNFGLDGAKGRLNRMYVSEG